MKKAMLFLILPLCALLLSGCAAMAGFSAVSVLSAASMFTSTDMQEEGEYTELLEGEEYTEVEDPYSKFYEALDWLQSNKNPHAFTSNRFESTEEAIKFVKRLYAAGAVKVFVTDVMEDPDIVKEEGGPYADTLLVEMPDDKGKRQKLLDIYNEESEETDMNYGEPASIEYDMLYFWWE